MQVTVEFFCLHEEIRGLVPFARPRETHATLCRVALTGMPAARLTANARCLAVGKQGLQHAYSPRLPFSLVFFGQNSEVRILNAFSRDELRVLVPKYW
ncbi:MAG: hypothetical protein F6K28_06970 [Microcoleus sp. SIO2G3]|nr:hypothetical protein [Microcoleus sp. SIO2G3]